MSDALGSMAKGESRRRRGQRKWGRVLEASLRTDLLSCTPEAPMADTSVVGLLFDMTDVTENRSW